MSQPHKHIALLSMNQFHPRLSDGASRSLLAWLQFLREQGNQVTILHLTLRGFERKAFTAELASVESTSDTASPASRGQYEGLGFYQEVLPIGVHELGSHSNAVVKAFLRCMPALQIDYALTTDEGYWPLLAAWYLGIPGGHGFNSIENVRAFARHPEHVRLLATRTVFANCRFLQEQVGALLGLEAVVAYKLLDFAGYRINLPKSRGEAVGYYSRADPRADALAAAIFERLPEQRFVVVGKRYQSTLENVDYWGFIPDMRRFYQAIDVLLITSFSDTSPRVILEAAVNGIPVIANHVGGIEEVLGDSGMLIECQDGESSWADVMADRHVSAIRAMLGDEARYREHSNRALSRAEEYEREQSRWAAEVYERHIR
jgi:glycosyltransferase involved in cell wall biosynthesis